MRPASTTPAMRAIVVPVSKRLVYLALVALLGAAATAAAWRGVRSLGHLTAAGEELPMRGGGVVAFLAPPAPRGRDAAASADAGDLGLGSERLRLVIGGPGEGFQRQQQFGALTDLGLASGDSDELLELRSVMYVAGSPLPLRTLRVDVAKAGERPVLAVEEVSRDGRFKLNTEYHLAPRQSRVEIVTYATNLSGKPVPAVQLGDRARWPGTPIFAPRLGYVQVATHADVPWLARVGRKLTYGLVFPDGPAQAALQFDLVGPAGDVTLGASAEVLPGARVRYRRDAVVVAGGLGELAQISWLRLGKTLGYARGVLASLPAWATVDARHLDGPTVLSVQADASGHFELPLPPGEYRFVLRAPGGEDEGLGTVPAAGGELRLNLVPPLAGRLSYFITDEARQPMPARLVVRGLPPTKDPLLTPAEGAAGTQNVVYTLSGAGTLELPAGRYDVLATRGPEYALARQEVEVKAELGATFRGELRRVVDTTNYIATDLHVHALPSSDSQVSLPERVLSLAGEGIEFAVPTDHNHVTDYSPAIRSQGLGGRLGTVSGVEITTPSWGHFNAFPYPSSVAVPPFENTSPLEIFSVVRARAPLAVLQVNHPRMPGVGYFNRGELNTKTGVAESPEFSFGFDTLEVANGFDLENPSVLAGNLREWFELLNAGHRYTAVGSSDSHRLVYQWAGWPRTYVKAPDERPSRVDPSEIARALIAGHALVSCGIFVLPVANGSAGPGDSVAGPRVSLEVSVRAPEWVDVSLVEIYANGSKIEERRPVAPLAESTWNFQVDLEFRTDTWIVVVARGEEFMNDPLPGKWIRPFGFANPIFIDVDEDGKFSSVEG